MNYLLAAWALAKSMVMSTAGKAAAVGSVAGVGVPMMFGGGGDNGPDRSNWIHMGGHAPRRRRRRALTQSDKNDIAFIAAALGETTGRKFALIIAARA